jgi:hypothetical protein
MHIGPYQPCALRGQQRLIALVHAGFVSKLPPAGGEQFPAPAGHWQRSPGMHVFRGSDIPPSKQELPPHPPQLVVIIDGVDVVGSCMLREPQLEQKW